MVAPLQLTGKGATQTRGMDGNKLTLRPDLSGGGVEKGLSLSEPPSP